MSLVNKTNFLSKYLKDLAIFLKYSSREKRCLFIATVLFFFALLFRKADLKELPFLAAWQFYILFLSTSINMRGKRGR